MIIFGLKLTHDAAFCIIDGNKLLFSIEIEKVNNNRRYTDFTLSYERVLNILGEYNFKLEDIDLFVIDGWTDYFRNSTKGTMQFVPLDLGTGLNKIEVSGYGYLQKGSSVLKERSFHSKTLNVNYSSYSHISSHIVGAYCSSPFAARNESAHVLVWDGAIAPQLFYWDAQLNRIREFGVVMPVIGGIYPHFSTYFEPFAKERYVANVETGIAGKLMAYIALGQLNDDLVSRFHQVYTSKLLSSNPLTRSRIDAFTESLITDLVSVSKLTNLSSTDILTTFHVFVEQLLLLGLKQSLVKAGIPYIKNLCYAGGCALNIKWNSALRKSGAIENLWIPPFPNDSGSAIGTACCAMVNRMGLNSLAWDIYSGPRVQKSSKKVEWGCMPDCTIPQLAWLICRTGEPVVILEGASELGPRALGARSILALPQGLRMKDLLNQIKDREFYRPVAPICLEELAPQIFDPGSPDPYMLFDHTVRPSWRPKVPAICHLDFTARVQTVNAAQNKFIYQLLKEVYSLTGIPLLCNTSANFNGKGFFPDVKSVMEWNKVSYIFSEGSLYFKGEAPIGTDIREGKYETHANTL